MHTYTSLNLLPLKKWGNTLSSRQGGRTPPLKGRVSVYVDRKNTKESKNENRKNGKKEGTKNRKAETRPNVQELKEWKNGKTGNRKNTQENKLKTASFSYRASPKALDSPAGSKLSGTLPSSWPGQVGQQSYASYPLLGPLQSNL